MNILTVIAPLIGVILGSCLTGVGVLLRQRAEKKRVVGVALADLLEIRHELMSTERALKHLRSRFSLPDEIIPNCSNLLESILPKRDDLHKRYEESVSVVASFDPVLGFKLRSKNNIADTLSKFRKVAVQNGVNLSVLNQYESMLRKALLPPLEKAVTELGRHHSRRTAKSVKELLSKGDEVPPETALLFDEMQTLLS
jgi:hypothetical protein